MSQVKAPAETRVLVADDDLLVRAVIRRDLEMIGYRVAGEAADGEEAVRLVSELEPDVILMDIEMPGLDGLAAARRIQQVAPTPVVVLTAHDSGDLLSRASAEGVGAYLTKPPEAGAIERAITIAIARHGDLVHLRHLNDELERKNEALQQALDEISTLRGIIPMCMGCKKIRNDKGYWQQVEVYIREHSDAVVSHGLCEECVRQLYPHYSGGKDPGERA
jgi:CheY-like chemotaxis protein